MVEIDRWFPSSKLCSNCFYQMSEMPLDVREWTCPHCGTRHDRDRNAAMNIRSEGIRMLKAEGDARRLANASLSAVWAFGGEVSPKMGRKAKVSSAALPREYRSPTFRRSRSVTFA
ncbi:MAG: zinc ribbon domain-containing protein [Gloeotrichia echinulata DEX184]